MLTNQTIFHHKLYLILATTVHMIAGRVLVVMALSAVLLVPAGALGQTADRIAVLDSLGTHPRGGDLFVFGTVANPVSDAFLIMQITNPAGDLCQIQQITTMSNGVFLTEPISLSGSLCGIEGDYTLQLFYGDYQKSSTFTVSGTSAALGDSELLARATSLATDKIGYASEASGLDASPYTVRLDSSSTLADLEELYVDLWDQIDNEDALFEITPVFRPAVKAALDASSALFASGVITPEISEQIDHSVYAAIFYHEIGDTNRAILIINDVFVQLQNVDPVKPQPRQLTFSQLEETLLNLMTKTDSVMSPSVKQDIAFILARGTAPLFYEEINDLVDLLTKTRYLDVVSRKDASLYRLVNAEWASLREILSVKSSVDSLLETAPEIGDLHNAALLLRQLDRVDRFLASEDGEESGLLEIIEPEWDSLESRLDSAASVRDILDYESEIHEMKSVIEISSRISKSVDIARDLGADVEYVDRWGSLLDDVGSASSVGEILGIVSAFDSSITELREKRDPLVTLKFEFEQLKQKAELQADYENLVLVNQALQIIKLADQTQKGSPTTAQLDRAELLLTWVSHMAPTIRGDLEESAAEAYEEKAADILQRAKSLENLADLSLRNNKFLPGFIDFVESVHDRLDRSRALVMQNDLDAADFLVNSLFSEWQTISKAYIDDPRGSPAGYSLDELQRIQFRDQLKTYSQLISAFHHPGFDEYRAGYDELAGEADDLIRIGNFIDAEAKIKSIEEYLSEHLPLKDPRIIYDISYDPYTDIWTIQGAFDKPVMDRRENVYVVVYDMYGEAYGSLEFTDTRQGNFFTQWRAPFEPGLYVVMLHYQNVSASQIAHVPDKTVREPRSVELDSIDIAREFGELQVFIEEFGGPNESHHRISSTVGEIGSYLADRDAVSAGDKLKDLKLLIERYLPVRSPSAVIEVGVSGDTIVISGAVHKTLDFREDLFIDIFDQRGNLVRSVSLQDDPSGLFNKQLSIPLESGVHVAQLEYHDLAVTDFFTVP